VTAGKATRLTWSHLGIAVSLGLVVFGVVDAVLPHPTLPSAAVSGLGAPRNPDPHVANSRSKPNSAVPSRSAPSQSPADTAAQRVAEQFVMATDITDPTHPEGDTAEQSALAPGLGVPRQPLWPAA